MLSQKRIGLGPWLALGILCPLCLFLSQACLAEVKGGAQEGTPSGGSSDPHDWLRFNPYKFQPAMRLVPNASAVDKSSNVFQAGQTFAHDPTKSNIVFGRGTKSLPTAIYAKAFDVLQIGGKYYQAPGAGGSKQIVIDGEVLTIFGTTVYTPLPDNRYVGNPGQVSPFDPTKIFYKDNGMWPSVIYGEPGKELTIAGKKVTVPAAGQVTILTVGKDGHLKVPGDSSSGSQSASSSSDASGGAGKPSSQTSSASSSSSSSSGTSAGTSSSASANANHGSGSNGSGSGSGSSSASGTSSSSGGSSSGAGQKDNSTTNANQSSEKAAAEKAAAEKAAAEKAAAEKAAAERLAAEKIAEEKAAAERAAAEKAAAEKAAAERLAAEKVAAERAAAEKAAAEKAAAEKAAAERDAAEKAAAEKALAEALANMQFDMSYEKAAQALAGEWGLINTSTTLSAKLKIQANGAAIEGIITDQGSGYIPAGKTRFSGTITGNPFQVTVLRAYPGFTDPYNESGSLAVTSATDIKITAPTGNLVLRRLSAISSQQSASGSQSSSSSSSSSSSGTQQISQPAGSGSGSSSNTSNSSQGTQSDISCP